MRIAAGILMILLGSALAFFLGVIIMLDILLFDVPIPQDVLFLDIFIVISGVYSVIGGLFCVLRRYWKVCFSSALLFLGIVIYFRVDSPASVSFIPLGILPLIFLILRKKEWQKPQA